MRRPFSRSKLHPGDRSCQPLRLERLEDRLALSHAPLFGGELPGSVPGESPYFAESSPELPAIYGSAYGGASDTSRFQSISMNGPGPDHFEDSFTQGSFQDHGYDQLIGRSDDFGTASPAQYGSGQSTLGSNWAAAPNGFRDFQQSVPLGLNLGSGYSPVQVTIVPPVYAPQGYVVVVVQLNAGNVDPGGIQSGYVQHDAIGHDNTERDIVERPVDTRPDLPAHTDIVALDLRNVRVNPAVVAVNIAPELSHVNQPASSISLGADSLARAQATNQLAQGIRSTDLAPSASTPQASQPMTMLGELGSSGQGALALAPNLDSHGEGESPSQGDSQSNSNPNPSGLQAEAPHVALVSNEAAASGSDAESGDLGFLISGSSRGALVASLPFNVSAVDQALATMMAEVEGLGVELAGWLEESSVPPWALLATVVVTCGVGSWYYGFLRVSGSPRKDTEEESSSWLFTQLENPAGQR